jgi:hypothetical protein
MIEFLIPQRQFSTNLFLGAGDRLTFSCAHLDLAGSCGFYLFYVFPRFVVFGSTLPLFPLFSVGVEL